MNKSLAQKAADIIEKKYYLFFGSADIATELGVSKYHLIHIFGRHYGCTPGEYLKQIKIKNAAVMLKCSDYSIETVALLSGFASSGYFGKVFRKEMCQSPTEYRFINKNIPITDEEEMLMQQIEMMIHL